jgi:SAM-dependent methyltransferase
VALWGGWDWARRPGKRAVCQAMWEHRCLSNGGSAMVEESGFQVADGAAENYQAHIEKFMGPMVVPLAEASVSPGDEVLDVACGTGFATRAAAHIAGRGGRVVGTDINTGMLTVAESVKNDSACQISWEQASALELPFADGEFDTVICSQGVQFFPDTAAGLAEMKRVARPGGRVGATVWAPRVQTPYLDAMAHTLMRFCGVDPTTMDGPFANDDSQVRGWFVDGGLEQVDVELVEILVSLPPVREFFPEHMTAMPWSESFSALDDGARDEALGFAESLLGDYRTDSGIEAPFRVFRAIATA